MKKNLINLTKNIYVFYVVSLLAILNVLGYFSMRSWHCIVMFAAVAYSTKCYSKNNVIALLAGLFVANFVFGCNRVKENFEEALDPMESIMDNLDVQKEKAENSCPKGQKMGVNGACIEELANAKEAMSKAKEMMGQLGGGAGIEKMMDALTNMGK